MRSMVNEGLSAISPVLHSLPTAMSLIVGLNASALPELGNPYIGVSYYYNPGL